MAKGKKKDPTKKQPVSEEQPSTSSQVTAEPEQDEGGLGLDLGGGRKKKKQKAAQEKQAEAQAKPESAPVAAPAVVPAPEPKVEEVTAMEEEFDGLGLSIGGKKKPRRKKKADSGASGDSQPGAAAPAPSQPSEAQVPQAGVMPSSQSTPAPGQRAQQPPPGHGTAPGQWSQPAQQIPPGQSTPAPGQWGQRAQQPPPGHGTAPGQWSQPAQQIPPSQSTPAPGQWGQPAQQIPPGQSTPAPGQWGQRAQQPPPGHGTAPGQWSQPAQQIPPSQSTPAPGQWGQPAQQIPPGQSTPAPGQWGQPAQNYPPSQSVPQTQPSRAGAGRGKGRGQTSQPLPGASTDRGQSAQYRPSPPPQQQPSAARPTSQYSPAMEQGAVMCRYKVPKKIPGGVIRARPVDVITNYLPMTIKALKISRYDVTFKPDRPKKLIPVAFKQVKNKYYPNEVIAFDQMKNCYSLRPLSNVPKNDRFTTTTDVQDINGKVIKYEVSFKETGLVDLGKILSYMATGGTSLNPPTEEIQCVDVILRQGTLEAYIKAGRQFFQRPAKPIDLGDGLEMWTGLFQSAIFTSRSFINIDVAHKGFPKQQPLIDAMSRDFRLDLNRPVEQQYGRGAENFVTFIKGLRVVTTLVGQAQSSGQKREFICNGLVDPPTHMTFLIKDEASGKERKITVAEYFAKEKQYRIRYPKLNCVWVGHRDKNIYFPMELLQVSYGQPINKQLNETQLANMVREAATPPDERLRKISQVISHMNYPKNEQFKKFGLEISDQFFSVKGKVLDAPSLEVGEGRVIPRKGVWQANKLLKPEALQSWGFIAIETDPRCDYENVISMLMNSGRTMGMTVSEPRLRLFDAKMQSLHNILFTALEKEIKFLFIIVSTRGRDYYHKVKQMAERDVGILTQCIKEFTASRKMNPMTARNILLKVNSKLMGINQALDGRSLPRCLKDGGVMIVGADVTHPSPDQTSIPSIAAVTASIDPKCYMYNIELSIQTPKKEMIVEFEDMMVDHFKIYKQNNQNYMPRKIFVFRDGVSEGQFAQVMNSELQAVHNAYRRMAGANAKPEILFLLVQKRHHTRFFLPKNSQYNVEPGTVVDREIVHASELDFYLVSHQAIKGTARPTRYHAVCNDGAIPDDEVEQLTYYLCHLYSRCMRAVSYPTPTYYAHLACLRARSLTHGEKFDNKELEKSPKRLRVLDKMLQYSRMFFV